MLKSYLETQLLTLTLTHITSLFSDTALLNINTLSNVTEILAPNELSPLLTTKTGISREVTSPDIMLFAFGTAFPLLSLQKQVEFTPYLCLYKFQVK